MINISECQIANIFGLILHFSRLKRKVFSCTLKFILLQYCCSFKSGELVPVSIFSTRVDVPLVQNIFENYIGTTSVFAPFHIEMFWSFMQQNVNGGS